MKTKWPHYFIRHWAPYNDFPFKTSLVWVCLHFNNNPVLKLTQWKRLWCWEGLGAGGEGDNRGWDGWMALLARWTWVWVNSGSWWWTGRPGVLWFMRSQRVWHDWATELNWTERRYQTSISFGHSFFPLYSYSIHRITIG